MVTPSAGDTIAVWWGAKTATITDIVPHDSGMDGWSVMVFGDGKRMTFTPLMIIEYVERRRSGQ